jgi:hypothetical protein
MNCRSSVRQMGPSVYPPTFSVWRALLTAQRLAVQRLLIMYRAENIGSALKGGVNICQRYLVNEVRGPLVTEFVRNFGREDATPIQHTFPTAAFSVKLVRPDRTVSPSTRQTRPALREA